MSMLDLTRFTEKEEAIVPVIEGWGQFAGRKIYKPGLEDGWYKIEFGDAIDIKRKATQLEIYKTVKPLKQYQVLALGTEGIPLNFDTFKQHGWPQSINVNFLNASIFTIVKIIQWEDKRFYFVEPYVAKSNRLIQDAKKLFEDDKSLSDLQGATPELRYYTVLCGLQRESIKFLDDLERFVISDDERKRRIESFRRSFKGRLMESIVRAGGTYISHSRKANGYLVTWSINGEVLKSEIRDDLRIISAGFCLSGYDKAHSMNSIVNLAKLYIEDDTLNITRV